MRASGSSPLENTCLPNPSHYAYHEGGPEGWEYDEEHGIGTYPHTEVSSRTVYMHRLPADRQDALAAWEDKERPELSAAEWSMRGGAIDLEVARTGNRSLRCAKDDPAEGRRLAGCDGQPARARAGHHLRMAPGAGCDR